MIEIVSDIIKALNRETLEDGKALHHNILNLMEESLSVWRADYTIAVAKDDSKEKVSNFMVCNELNETPQTFRVKRENDFWKKLDARDDYKAVVECSFFSTDSTMCKIEKVGRDIMRSRKEVHNVADLGFVWVVRIGPQENIDSVFQLYFKEDYITLKQDESKYYIGWTEKLKELDMRYFVCDPTAKEVKNEIVDFSTDMDMDPNMQED
jgi:hypothetical protein